MGKVSKYFEGGELVYNYTGNCIVARLTPVYVYLDTAMKIDLACGNDEVVFNKNSGLLTGSKGNECTTWSHLGRSTYSHQFCNFTSGCHSSRN